MISDASWLINFINGKRNGPVISQLQLLTVSVLKDLIDPFSPSSWNTQGALRAQGNEFQLRHLAAMKP